MFIYSLFIFIIIMAQSIDEFIEKFGSETGIQAWYQARENAVPRLVEGFVNGIQRSFVDWNPRQHSFVKYLDGVYQSTRVGAVAYYAGAVFGRLIQGAAVLYSAQHIIDKL